tara:strand:+ start:581 stop:898 length:318 start_codon:yes stop_codon:yes gene_type:complete
MEIKKILTWIIVGIILTGCAQSTAMIGPAFTLASTGNASQAGLTFFTNKAIEKETGMDTVTYVSKKIEQQNSKTKLKREFKNLVETNFVKTREKLILQDKSNIFN